MSEPGRYRASMTWVIGLAAPGFAVGVADIRITLETHPGTYRPVTDFGVQKIHLVGESMAIGFSGPIRTGFLLVEDFRRFATGADDVVLGDLVERWADTSVSGALAKIGREAFIGPWQVIVLTVPSSRDWGPPDVVTGLAYSQGCTVTSRGDHAEIEDIPLFEACHIGSGSEVEEYRSGIEAATTLEQTVSLTSFGMATETLGLGGPGMVMGVVVTGIIESRVDPTVSADVMVCCIERGGVTISTNQNVTRRRWPPIATNWAELQKLAGGCGINAAALTA